MAGKENNGMKDSLIRDYKYGFSTDIQTEKFPKGLDENIIRRISAKKEEPDWLLSFRLKAFRHWNTMKHPDWARLKIPPIDFQNIAYYSAPKPPEKLEGLHQVDPELLKNV